MPSYLTFSSTDAFRRRCLIKNLQPYTIPGVFTPPSITDIVHETVQTVSSVIDSPDNLIAFFCSSNTFFKSFDDG